MSVTIIIVLYITYYYYYYYYQYLILFGDIFNQILIMFQQTSILNDGESVGAVSASFLISHFYIHIYSWNDTPTSHAHTPDDIIFTLQDYQCMYLKHFFQFPLYSQSVGNEHLLLNVGVFISCKGIMSFLHYSRKSSSCFKRERNLISLKLTFVTSVLFSQRLCYKTCLLKLQLHVL